MTNERAVEILNLDLDILGQYGGETAEAYKMAIKALEAQPCEDAVSRSELQKTMDSLPLFRFVNNDHEEADDYYNCESVDMVIRNLPSVTPRINLALTSQDCISREEAINEADNLSLETSYDNEKVEQMLRDLPPVKPQYTDEEIDKAQAVEQAYVDKMVELAVEEAKRPKGKWIKIQSGDKDFPESIVCSRCKNENSHLDFDEHSEPIGKVFVTSKYCPNCGAEMSGGGEDEVNN